VTASVTAGVSDDEGDIVDGLKSDIEGDPDLDAAVTVTKIGSDAAATMTIAAKAGKSFAIANATDNLVITLSTSETAADMLAAARLEDDDWFIVTAHDKDSAFVVAMAT